MSEICFRVVDTIAAWGGEQGYFASEEDEKVFRDELMHLMLHQKASFNSPVWFNVGVEPVPQCSACFIISVDDTMESILHWYTQEGIIFKGGSGSGVNVSRLRSAREPLTGGGTASGPISFMKAADASAGVIKSGGKTRRAAKMVIVNVDHPDILEFIRSKADEEKKAHALVKPVTTAHSRVRLTPPWLFRIPITRSGLLTNSWRPMRPTANGRQGSLSPERLQTRIALVTSCEKSPKRLTHAEIREFNSTPP